MQKEALFRRGVALLEQFCQANNLYPPVINVRPWESWPFDVCAYYRPVKIEICLSKCAAIGVAGRQWSFPGYSVDRTPYGVLQHELGHHADITLGNLKRGYQSPFSQSLRAQAKEPPLTGYCPDDGEWFAEMFRLFVTNPDLLERLRPRSFALIRCYFSPVVSLTWEQVLKDAPARTLDACRRKIKE
jgi:hypothetical protein